MLTNPSDIKLWSGIAVEGDKAAIEQGKVYNISELSAIITREFNTQINDYLYSLESSSVAPKTLK